MLRLRGSPPAMPKVLCGTHEPTGRGRATRHDFTSPMSCQRPLTTTLDGAERAVASDSNKYQSSAEDTPTHSLDTPITLTVRLRHAGALTYTHRRAQRQPRPRLPLCVLQSAALRHRLDRVHIKMLPRHGLLASVTRLKPLCLCVPVVPCPSCRAAVTVPRGRDARPPRRTTARERGTSTVILSPMCVLSG